MAMRVNGNITGSVSNSKANMSGKLTTGIVNISGGTNDGYSKEEVDELLNGKAEKDHEHYVGSGLNQFTLQEAYNNLNQTKVTKYEVNQSISEYAAPKDHTHEDLQSQIDDLKTSVSNGKILLASAITDKGVNTLATDTFQTMANNIKEIPQEGGGDTPVAPKPEVEDWVKPDDWIDIKADIPESTERILVSDIGFSDRYDYDISLSLTYIVDGDIVDWGDGTVYTHSSGSTTSLNIKHKYDKTKRHVYVDKYGFERGQYVIEIRRSTAINLEKSCTVYSSTGSNKLSSVLWYVNNNKNGSVKIDMCRQQLLECCEVLDTSISTKISCIKFTGCTSLKKVYLGNNCIVQPNPYDIGFNDCPSLTYLDVSNWDTSKVTTMYNLFGDCSSLTYLDVSNWDTSKVTNMQHAFNKCSSLTYLDVSNWDTSKVTNMTYLFSNCSSLTYLDVSNWDTSKVTTMQGTFEGCSSLTSIDVSNWDTSKVTTMYSLFNKCSSLTSIDVSNWDTSKVTDMNSMFATCTSLTDLKPERWDFSKVKGYASYGVDGLMINNFFKDTQPAKLEVIFLECEDYPSSYSAPLGLDLSLYSNANYVDLSVTIPRPSLTQKITISGSTSYENHKLQRLIIKGQETMDFTAASPQIKLDYTYVFREDRINEFFTNLPNVDPSKNRTISIKNNPHVQFADINIAIEKGWQVLYDSTAQSASIVPLGDEERFTNSQLVYCFIPGEDGTFVDANGNKCNLLYSQSVATMNPTGWEMFPTFDDALSQYGIEVDEEHREEIAREVLDYANDKSLMIRYNIED